MRVIPAMLPPPPPAGAGQGVEAWIIVVSVIAAVIVIAVVAGLLWGVRQLHCTHHHYTTKSKHNPFLI